MRIRIKIKLDQAIQLPRESQHFLQGLVYKCLKEDPYFSGLLHDEGLDGSEKKLKYFCFSQLFGADQSSSRKYLSFPHELSFWVSSVEPYVIILLEKYIQKHGLCIGEYKFKAGVSVEREASQRITRLIQIDLLSPLVMNRSLSDPYGARLPFYLGPEDASFFRLLNANFVTKYRGLFHQEPESEIQFILDPENSLRACHLRYQTEQMSGWLGGLILSGRPDYLRLLYDCGIGAKNSQGCGLFKICKCQGEE